MYKPSPDKPLLEVRKLKKHFPLDGGLLKRKTEFVRAVDEVSFSIAPGRTLGLVGESGSEKTTVGRCILNLIKPSGGSVFFNDVDLGRLSPAEMKSMRGNMQIIFQDPYGSLTPRLRLSSILREPLDIHGVGSEADKKEAVAQMMKRVGLRPEQHSRFPHEFSGGAATTDRHRPGFDARTEACCGRRAGQRSGRVHPGPDYQPDGPAPERDGPELSADFP